MRYRGLLLDFYGTLVEEDGPIIARVVQRVVEAAPRQTTPHAVAREWDRLFCAGCSAAHGPAFRTQRDIELTTLSVLLKSFECHLDAQELSAELFEYWRRPRPFPDSAPFLKSLTTPLCIVSNIDAADLQAALDALGWHFHAVVTSESCRSYKPHPSLFTHAVQTLGLRPREVLHVGDSITADVKGAQAAGIDVAWLNRALRQPPTPPPTYCVSTLAALPATLTVKNRDRPGF